MSMLQWIKGLIEDEHAVHTPPPDTIHEHEEEAGGLNFKTAIDAHLSWKHRLTDFINGKLDEKLDHETVSHDHNCALGKWIYGDGEAHYGQNPLFQQLKQTHQQFHHCAGKIILEVDKGNHQQASSMIANGDYPLISTRVTSQLAQLYIQFKNA